MKKPNKNRRSLSKITLEIQKLIESSPREFFAFEQDTPAEEIVFRFNLFARRFYPKFFTSKDAPFHNQIDQYNAKIWKGEITSFLNIAFRGASKRQPLDAKVLTPNGWTTIGKLKIGDFVIGSDGRKNRVVGLSPTVDRPVYKVETEDGRKTECDVEHLWTVRKMSNVAKKHETIDVATMLKNGYFYGRIDKRYDRKFNEYKYALETVKPVEFAEKKLPIDPYTLGVILGDGNINKEWGGVRIHFHKDDEKHYRENLIGNLSETKFDKRNTNVGRFGINGVGQEIINLGLNVNCYSKFIPNEYLFGSVKQRRALLEGLMDTDGSVPLSRKRNYSSFCSVSERLADDVVSLVRSLGGRAVKRERKGDKKKNGVDYFTVSIVFTDYKSFRLKRKLENCGLARRTWSRISNIELVGDKKGRCIMTENEDGLYVTDDYLLTHNTTRTKLFLAFAILNDSSLKRKYIKVLCREQSNSTQFVTDIYNLIITVGQIYPHVFKKTAAKREETMSSFTTSAGIKVQAGTIGTSQRGDIQDEARPDVIVYDDFEDRLTLRSAVITKSISDTMEEARTGLAKGGGSIYLANYISEQGNVHKLVEKTRNKLIIPIIKDGEPTWPERYTLEDIKQIEVDADDYAGEYLCKPDASKDVYFDREILDKMEVRQPIKEISGFRIYREYNPSHRYAGGHDVAGGVGLDSSASVFIDFSTIPAQVVATFHSNTILPEAFGDEIYSEANHFGGCLVAPENNKYDQVILKAKQLGAKVHTHPKGKTAKTIYQGNPKYEYGWNTNALSKSKMFADGRKAVNDGLVVLNDPDLIKEAKAYTRNDLIDRAPDPRDVTMETRHFDLLTAFCIAWQLKDFAEHEEIPYIVLPTMVEDKNNPAE